jgi:hypothetical protein
MDALKDRDEDRRTGCLLEEAPSRLAIRDSSSNDE